MKSWKRLLIVTVGIGLSLSGVLGQAAPARAVSETTRASFIASLVGAAQNAQRKFGVPASVSMAQAIEASAWGTSAVAKKANNYFNTPCSGLMTASQYADLADAQVGKPYLLGANGPARFDCSSLVIWVNNESGAYRMGDDTASGLYNRSRSVSGSPAVGDLVFLRNNPARANGIGHTAVLTKRLSDGDWRIIEARGRAYGVVRTTLSYWKKRSYYAGLRRLPKLTLAKAASATSSAARLYQAGCITIGSAQYAKFTSMANSFYANAASITGDAVYKSVRSAMSGVRAFVDALAKVVKPNDPASYARDLNSLIDTYNLTTYDIVPISLVLESGSGGAKVTALQYLLRAAGYPTAITGKYDSATVSAVKKLQKAKKLEVDGEAGQNTLAAMFTKLSSGASGPRVGALHALLGSFDDVTTGKDTFGPVTVAAVKSFQTKAGRPATGAVDTQTWAALFMTLDAGRPAVSGVPQVGQTLQASAGIWGPGSVGLSYQWYRGATAIGGATSKTYQVQPHDVGAALTVVVSGSRVGYTAVTRTSAATAGVVRATFAAADIPKINGTRKAGKTLTVSPGEWKPGPSTYSYQWYRGSTRISGATHKTYNTRSKDRNKTLYVSVTGSRDGYTAMVRKSAGVKIA